MALMEIKSRVDFQMILRSDEPSFMTLKKQWGVMELAKPVMALTDSFLRSCYPDQVDISSDVAVLMIEREPTWTLLDVINFYKTIIVRQDIKEFNVMGNKITVLKLMQMVGEYEGLKADEREVMLSEQKEEGKIQSKDLIDALAESNVLSAKHFQKNPLDNAVSIRMGKMLEKIQVRDDDKKPYSVPADEKWFKQFEQPVEYDSQPAKENIV